MLQSPLTNSLESTRYEQQRIVAAAKDLFLLRGLEAVALADVAVSLRLPLEAVEHHFPAGKPALVQAALKYHLDHIYQHLVQQHLDSTNAVEELLAMRRSTEQGIRDAGVLVFHDLQVYYPVSWRYLRYARTRFMQRYVRANLQRGIQEGLYCPDLDPTTLSWQWLQQVGVQQATAQTPTELAEARYAHLSWFLSSIATSLGLYVIQRLQEAAPYY